MDTSDRLVRLLVARAARLEDAPEIDRHAVDRIGDLPARPVPARSATPVRPWDAVRGSLGVHGVIDASAAGEQLLAALLDPPDVSAEELELLYRRVGLTPAQRLRVLEHANTPGDLLIEYVCDSRHDAAVFDPEQMQRQIALLRQAAGVSGDDRVRAWSTLTLRTASSAATDELVGDVLVASPNATAVLHASVERALDTRRSVPAALGRHLMSHMTAPATLAVVPLPALFRVIDQAEEAHVRADRAMDTICDLVASSCSTDPARWARMFELARHWDRSLGALLDEVEQRHVEVAPLVLGGRRSSPYQRERRSALSA